MGSTVSFLPSKKNGRQDPTKHIAAGRRLVIPNEVPYESDDDPFRWKRASNKQLNELHNFAAQAAWLNKVDDNHYSLSNSPLTTYLCTLDKDRQNVHGEYKCIENFFRFNNPDAPPEYPISAPDGSEALGGGRCKAVEYFPKEVAHKYNDALSFPKHAELRRAMNMHQQRSDDIIERKMPEKHNANNKWKVMGVIDPNKHMATLDHLHNLDQIRITGEKLHYVPKLDLRSLRIVNYHHWIPSVFYVNEELTECKLLSDIPDLDPYGCRDTLYPLITDLFLHQIPQFEHVTGSKQRDAPLRVIVKAQDYQLTDCSPEDAYLGNLHREGLYEKIVAVGLYYYQIDEGIKGGELEISSVIAAKDEGDRGGRTVLRRTKVAVSEGMSLVFSNKLCYHRVCRLHGNGSRKIIAFFLMDYYDRRENNVDARYVTVNWKYHAKVFVERGLREIANEHPNAGIGNEWFIELVQQYVVGDRQFIAEAVGRFRHCHGAQLQTLTTTEAQVTRTGYSKFDRRKLRAGMCD